MDIPENAAELVGREFVHFKGGHYLLHGFATDTESGETMVVYESLYGESPLPNDFGATQGGPWVRSAKMFFEHVEKPGYSGPRFKLLECPTAYSCRALQDGRGVNINTGL